MGGPRSASLGAPNQSRAFEDSVRSSNIELVGPRYSREIPDATAARLLGRRVFLGIELPLQRGQSDDQVLPPSTYLPKQSLACWCNI